jgi:hypothetical protein
MNAEVAKKSVADGKTKGCTCGSTKKNSSVVSCQDGLLRKSKCPCLKNNIYCSHLCKCSQCGNVCKDVTLMGANALETGTESTSVKRKRISSEPYKRSKGVDYLANEGFEISAGPWTKLETLTLSVVGELIKTIGLTVSPSNIAELYNYVACSNTVQKQLELPVAFKSNKRVLAKLAHLASKQSVFKSLMDSA